MNAPNDRAVLEPRPRYAAGVLKYKEMGYWQGDYEPKATDVIACSASRRRKASTPRKPLPRSPVNRRPQRGPWCGPIC